MHPWGPAGPAPSGAYSDAVTRFPPPDRPLTHMAIDCQWLRRTIDSSRSADPFRMLCTHIVRDGRDCVGPFLEDMETGCLLWEPNERVVARIRPVRLD